MGIIPDWDLVKYEGREEESNRGGGDGQKKNQVLAAKDTRGGRRIRIRDSKA